jgi:hypothetical protein
MGRWHRIALVGLGVVACGGPSPGLTQATPAVSEAEDMGSSSGGESPDAPVGGSTGAGWGGGSDEGSSSGGVEEEPGPDGNTVVSGTRLLRRDLAKADGIAGATGLWDSDLEVPCSFERTSDGELRCVPDVHGALMFADPACTQPVIVGPQFSCLEEDLRYARRYLDHSDCAWTLETYEAVDGQDPVEMPVYTSRSGACEAYGEEVAVAAERISDDALVRGVFTERARTDGMSMRIVVADDGAVWPESIVDDARGEACTPDGDTGRCLPAAPSVFSEWDRLRDGGCQQRVVDVDACSGSTLRGSEGACEPSLFHERGEHVDVDSLSQSGDDGVCEPAGEVFGTPVTVGSVIPFGAFPAVEVEMLGDGRIRELRYTDAEGDSLATGRSGRVLYDAELEMRCHVMLANDGVHRCVPPALAGTSIPLYADDQCSQRVVRVSADACGVPVEVPAMATRVEACDVLSVHTLGEPLDAEEVYWNLGSCSLALPFVGAGTYVHLGENVPLEAFAELSYVVDGA